MLAAIRLGKTFVPLAPDTPAAVRQELLRTLCLNRWVLSCDIDSGRPGLGHTGQPNLPSRALPGVMSIMFTSGSTGRPKGVMVPLSAVENLLYQVDFMLVYPNDVFACYSPLSFDASTFEIFTPLLNGASVCLLDKRLVLDPALLQVWLERHAISVMWLTAALFNQLVLANRAGGLAALRALVVGGDNVCLTAALTFLRQVPKTALYNAYGPTENTVFSLVARLEAAQLQAQQSVPVGRPVRGVQCSLFDAQGKFVDGAGTGSLFVSGAGLAQGYLDQPALTASAFPPNDAAVSGRYYDTGDWLARDATGVYYFLGRGDDQVKLNGHRVALGSIESRAVDGQLVHAVYAENSEQMGGLVLLCHAPHPAVGPVPRAYSDFLQQVLHPHEQPKQIVFTRDWPLTANGKQDRAALARQLALALRTTTPPLQVATVLEQLICQLTHQPAQEPSVKLFDAGLDSMRLIQLQVAIKNTFGIDLNILEMYEAATITGLQKKMEEKMPMLRQA